MSRKKDFNIEVVTRNKKEHCIIMKGSIHQENITITNICAPKNRASKYTKKK